jgi:hypothetical protein
MLGRLIIVLVFVLVLGDAFRLIARSSFRSSLQMTWQQEVDKLLNIDTSLEDRRELTRSVIGKLGEISTDVVDAVREQV